MLLEKLKTLFWMTITRPAEAAQMIINQNIDRTTGWMVMGAAILLNTLIFFMATLLFPIPAEVGIALLRSPFMVALLLGSMMVIFVFSFYWVGLSIGGKARFEDILLCIGWLQYMRFAIQLVSLALMLLLPSLSSLFVMATSLYGVWVVINFLKVAHQFKTLGKAVSLVLLAIMGLTVGLSIFLSLVTATAVGIS